jgi:hypothetical protein
VYEVAVERNSRAFLPIVQLLYATQDWLHRSSFLRLSGHIKMAEMVFEKTQPTRTENGTDDFK